MSDQQHAESNASSRRDFLKSAAAAGAAVATGLSFVPHVHAAGSDTIRVGLVGCGGRGSGAVDNVLHAAKNVEIVAIGDVFEKQVKSLRSRLQNRTANDAKVKELGNSIKLTDGSCHVGLDAAEKVINDPNVNYIILATPPGFRPPHLQMAVAAKKNI